MKNSNINKRLKILNVLKQGNVMEKKIYKETNKSEKETTVNVLYGETILSIYTNKVVQTVVSFSCNYNFLFNRNEKLKAINYECTLKEYNSKNQRRLMTKELRKKL